MLELNVPAREWFDETREEFVTEGRPCTLMLEHSLLSVSKWESKWRIPFLDDSTPKTKEQALDYIRCMTVNKNVDPSVYNRISRSMVRRIEEYVEDRQTATFINRRKKSARPSVKETVTSELIYFWMVSYNIPFECQKWHLSRLLMLIDVCAFKNEAPTRMTPNELVKRNSALNKSRRARLKTRG